MKYRFILLLSVLFLSSAVVLQVAAKSEYDWKMVADENGIQVYLKKIWADDVKSFRGVVHINSSLDSIVAVILDINACSDWIHHCKNPLLLAKISFSECYHYQVHQLPFPFKNREFIFHSKLTRSPETGSVTIQMKAVPGFCQENSHKCSLIPKSSRIRIKHSHGHYLLEPLDKNNTRVTWTHHTHPEGNLPIWLINSLVKEMPLRTLQGLRKKVFNSKYQKTKLIINDNGKVISLSNNQ
jgi:hypothetical protein